MATRTVLTLYLAAVAGTTFADAFKLVIDSNTMTVADLASASTGELRADGSYSIFVNTVPEATDKQWLAFMQGVSPKPTPLHSSLQFTEENPGTYDSCKMYKRITGQPPTASLGYWETGIIAGGTLLTGAEITKQAQECNSPVLVLTRAFCKTAPNKLEPGDDDAWIVNTTRAIAHPDVSGVAMEFTPGWPLSGQGCGAADLMNLAAAHNKTAVLLLPVYLNQNKQEAWENVRDLINGLYDSGAPMQSSNVVLALARYDMKAPRGPVPWWGSGNTVQHAYEQIVAMRKNRTASA